MLDENLPAFFLKPSSTGIKHHREFYLSHHGSEPAPAYTLQYADPSSPSPAHKNCYAAALFDAYNPEVLFAEVLARPGWTQPTPGQASGGGGAGSVPPPPQPVMPNEFAIQLYNPEQQVRVEVKSKWSGADSYEFSMPQDVFRTPSNSSLDKGQSDPASLDITPRIEFVWKKESKLNKDLTCYMTGKSTDKKTKKGKKDPDIAIGLWRQMRELTIYEPNLGRIDMEDPKGLEVVLLLSAVVIKDLYFSQKDQLPELFNISDGAARKLSSGGRKLSNPKSAYIAPPTAAPLSSHTPAALTATPNQIKRSSLPRLQTTPPQLSAASKPPPMADPRAQWELDAETARLKAQEEAEARERTRKRREREKADELERRRLQKMVEEEEKTARKKQADIDKETERLRKLYGVQPISQQQQPPRPQPNSSSLRPQQQPYLRPPQQPPRPGVPSVGSNGLYVQPSASASSVMMSGANGASSSSLGVNAFQRPAKKKSFFGLRSVSDDGGLERQRLAKKGSAMW